MSEDRFPVRLVNRFHWRHALLVSVPSTIVGLSNMISNGYKAVHLIFLIPIFVGVLVGFISGKNTVEYWKNNKWNRI